MGFTDSSQLNVGTNESVSSCRFSSMEARPCRVFADKGEKSPVGSQQNLSVESICFSSPTEETVKQLAGVVGEGNANEPRDEQRIANYDHHGDFEVLHITSNSGSRGDLPDSNSIGDEVEEALEGQEAQDLLNTSNCAKISSLSTRSSAKSPISTLAPAIVATFVPIATSTNSAPTTRQRSHGGKFPSGKVRMPPRDKKQTHWHPQTTINQQKRNTTLGNGVGSSELDIHSKPVEINVIRQDSLEDESTEMQPSIDTRITRTSVSSHASSVTLLTVNKVQSFMTDYYEDFDSIFRNGSSVAVKKTCFEAFFDQYYTKDILWIRASGNPIGRKDLANLLCDDIEVDRAVLVSIDSIRIMAGGLCATVVYTADLKFRFKGKQNSDRTILSSFVEADGSEMRIAHTHWSTGQPIPEENDSQ